VPPVAVDEPPACEVDSAVDAEPAVDVRVRVVALVWSPTLDETPAVVDVPVLAPSPACGVPPWLLQASADRSHVAASTGDLRGGVVAVRPGQAPSGRRVMAARARLRDLVEIFIPSFYGCLRSPSRHRSAMNR
jgi:hypothetical protein